MAYAFIAWFSFRRYAAYRLAAVGDAISNTMFGFLRAYILLALWEAHPSLGGYDATDAITYAFLTQALIGPVQIFGGMELTERIRTGDIAIDLHRPADLQGWWLADDLGRAAFTVVGRGIIPMIAGGLTFGLRFPGPVRWLEFGVSLLLAVLVSFAIRYLVALIVFWVHDSRSIDSVTTVFSLFMSGMILPLVVLPGWFGMLVRALPWSSLIQVPADVFLGKRTGWSLAGAYAFQAGWALALLVAGRLLTRLAHRRLVVNGG